MTSLKQLTIHLEKVARKYASQDIEAKNLLNSLKDIIDRAKNDEPISTEEKNTWLSLVFRRRVVTIQRSRKSLLAIFYIRCSKLKGKL